MTDAKLFLVYLGGNPQPGRIGEDHEVVAVVAADPAGAKKRAREKWGGAGKPHIDGITELIVVDGFAITLEQRTRRALDMKNTDMTWEA